MGLARSRSRVGPPSVLLLATLLMAAAAAPPFSAFGAPTRVDCGSLAPLDAAAAARANSASPPSIELRAQLGKRGELTGRVFTAQADGRAPISLSLPPESFVAKPVGDVIVYTRHTASTASEVRALNAATGCDVRLAAPPEIVRSALLDAAATAVFVHSVTRAGRADAGVVRHDLGTGSAVPVVAPLAPSEALGPIFGTELRWSIDGSALAVQSCGFSQCLTRVLNTATGEVVRYDSAGQGALIALTARHVVTYAACRGLPCAVVSTDLTSGAASGLAVEAFEVTATPAEAGSAVIRMNTGAETVEVVQ